MDKETIINELFTILYRIQQLEYTSEIRQIHDTLAQEILHIAAYLVNRNNEYN
jgi:hypothetical protein